MMWTTSASADSLYRLHLTDKKGADFCPLSQRALERRSRQGIVLEDTDRDVSPTYLATLRQEGWNIVARSRWLNTVVVSSTESPDLSAQRLSSYSFVASYQSLMSSSEGGTNLMTHTEQDTYEDNFRNPILEMHGERLHEAGYRGAGILIAILDGGWTNLPNLPNLFDKVVGWFDCYAPEDAEGNELFSGSTHGTQVLSCMAADTTTGVWGTAPEADYYLIRTEYAPTETPIEEDMWVMGAERADSLGADLINSSLGYSTFDDASFDHAIADLGQNRTFISQGASIACTKGMLVCSSAGNDRQRPWHMISFPADVPEVLTVGATDAFGVASSFSGCGWVAPYVKPDVACRGTASWIINALTSQPSQGSGTSYACPTLCGLMASLWSAVPDLSAEQLRQLVRENASLSQQPDSLMGYGIPDFSLVMGQLRTLALQEIGPNDSDLLSDSSDFEFAYDLQGRRIPRHLIGRFGMSKCLFVTNGGKRILIRVK